jgi:hypothetical protein
MRLHLVQNVKTEKKNSLVIQEEAAWVGPVSLSCSSTILAMIVAVDILFPQGMSPCRVVVRIEWCHSRSVSSSYINNDFVWAYICARCFHNYYMRYILKDGKFTHGYRYRGYCTRWAGYVHTFLPTGSTHVLPVKLWAGYGYSLLPAGIPIPYPIILMYGPRAV